MGLGRNVVKTKGKNKEICRSEREVVLCFIAMSEEEVKRLMKCYVELS